MAQEETVRAPQGEPDPASEERDAAQVEADIMALYDQVQRLQDERDQMKEQALRTMADFQNFRRRNQQEFQQFRQLANEDLVVALLPVLDNFERTVEHLQAGATVETMIEGVRAVEKQLRSVLEARNVQRISAVGEPFDPEVHEAIEMVPTTEAPDNTVLSEIEPGYRLGDRIIRPARVRVARSA